MENENFSKAVFIVTMWLLVTAPLWLWMQMSNPVWINYAYLKCNSSISRSILGFIMVAWIMTYMVIGVGRLHGIGITLAMAIVAEVIFLLGFVFVVFSTNHDSTGALIYFTINFFPIAIPLWFVILFGAVPDMIRDTNTALGWDNEKRAWKD